MQDELILQNAMATTAGATFSTTETTDMDGTFQTRSFGTGPMSNIKNKYSQLDARKRRNIPRYIAAIITSICALSFLSSALSFYKGAERN